MDADETRESPEEEEEVEEEDGCSGFVFGSSLSVSRFEVESGGGA